MVYGNSTGTARHFDQGSAVRRYKGYVKFWKEDRGFGFIVPDDPTVNGGSDVFVHISQTSGSPLAKEQRVSFGMGEDKKTGKPIAKEVDIA